jgi:hypothetical protein
MAKCSELWHFVVKIHFFQGQKFGAYVPNFRKHIKKHEQNILGSPNNVNKNRKSFWTWHRLGECIGTHAPGKPLTFSFRVDRLPG